MEDNTVIHPLARQYELSGRIRFIHREDGAEHTFSSCVNRLTGCRMSWFDSDAPDVDTPVSQIRTMFKNIRKKSAKVIESIGDF